MKKQNQMSSLDIAVILKELQEVISYRIENIYADESEKLFLLKLKGIGSLKNPQLLIEPGKRVHFTELNIDFPERPEGKILNLRSHLKGARFSKISQIGFDRLIEFTVTKDSGEFKLIVEFFGRRSNLIVINEQNKVVFAKWYRKMRDRDILPGKLFSLPPSKSISILEVSNEQLFQIIKESTKENITLIQLLINNFTGGGIIFEELIMNANLKKDLQASSLTDDQINQVVLAKNTLLNNIRTPFPVIYKDSSDKIINYAPFPYRIFNYRFEKYSTFSGVLDTYFLSIKDQRSEDYYIQDRKRKKLEKILSEQQRSLEKFRRRKKEYKTIGDLLYANFAPINELLTTILSAKKNNISWEIIIEKLNTAKTQGISSAEFFGGINKSSGKMKLELGDKSINIDFRKSISEIADMQYKISKKAARKIDSLLEEIKKTKNQLLSIGNELVVQSDVDSTIIKKRRRKWYEQYHWTITKNEYLVIGGKDVKSNELIVKRRLDNKDLFFHGDLHGSPYTLLKIQDKSPNPSEDDIYQAAHIAGVFSSAWKAGYGSVDVYYVSADSVSFTAPSGEFIPKGGIMVRGKRTYIRGIILELAIGIVIEEFHARIIYGIESVINDRCKSYLIIKPGDAKKGKIAKQILKFFYNDHEKGSDKAKINALDFNEVIQALPGPSQVSAVKRRKKH